jgi:hypothetical protein
MRIAPWVITATGLALSCQSSGPVDLVAIKPGIMCISAQAVAKLTLPNGDSRTHDPIILPESLVVAASGGCMDIPLGARFTEHHSLGMTSIVNYGRSTLHFFVVPNIDLRSVPALPGTVAGPSDIKPPSVPPGYVVTQRAPTDDVGGRVSGMMEDRRTAARCSAAGPHVSISNA